LARTICPTKNNKMSEIDEIIQCLNESGVVLLPTDTVYGLAVKPDLGSAVDKIYALKSRPRKMFLPVMVSAEENLAGLGLDVNSNATKILQSELVPGAVTIVFGFDPARQRLWWLDGREEVAIRIPDDPRLLEVLKQTGPLLVTSANKHKTVGTPNNVAEILGQLDGKPDLVIDGGLLKEVPSTIINSRYSPATIEREGVVPSEKIFNILNDE
jgi:L-threonylcarbamoyladenylate synthase